MINNFLFKFNPTILYSIPSNTFKYQYFLRFLYYLKLLVKKDQLFGTKYVKQLKYISILNKYIKTISGG